MTNKSSNVHVESVHNALASQGWLATFNGIYLIRNGTGRSNAWDGTEAWDALNEIRNVAFANGCETCEVETSHASHIAVSIWPRDDLSGICGAVRNVHASLQSKAHARSSESAREALAQVGWVITRDGTCLVRKDSVRLVAKACADISAIAAQHSCYVLIADDEESPHLEVTIIPRSPMMRNLLISEVTVASH